MVVVLNIFIFYKCYSHYQQQRRQSVIVRVKLQFVLQRGISLVSKAVGLLCVQSKDWSFKMSDATITQAFSGEEVSVLSLFARFGVSDVFKRNLSLSIFLVWYGILCCISETAECISARIVAIRNHYSCFMVLRRWVYVIRHTSDATALPFEKFLCDVRYVYCQYNSFSW